MGPLAVQDMHRREERQLAQTLQILSITPECLDNDTIIEQMLEDGSPEVFSIIDRARAA